MRLDLKPAFEIAVEVHGSQFDRGGEPYLGHICRVMSAMETDEERAVAILHDVIEDDPKAHPDFYWWAVIECSYGEDVRDAVMRLTHAKGEPYDHYLRRVSFSPLAVKVKVADLLDNMRADRLLKLPPEDRVRLLKKYQEAYEFLRKSGSAQ